MEIYERLYSRCRNIFSFFLNPIRVRTSHADLTRNAGNVEKLSKLETPPEMTQKEGVEKIRTMDVIRNIGINPSENVRGVWGGRSPPVGSLEGGTPPFTLDCLGKRGRVLGVVVGVWGG